MKKLHPSDHVLKRLFLLSAIALLACVDAYKRPPMGPWRPPRSFRSSSGSAALSAPPPAHAPEPHPLDQCEERWRDATLDHFSWSAPEVPGARTFKQRYYVCPRVRCRIWGRASSEAGGLFYHAAVVDPLQLLHLHGMRLGKEHASLTRPQCATITTHQSWRQADGPIFFYAGNEADVQL